MVARSNCEGGDKIMDAKQFLTDILMMLTVPWEKISNKFQDSFLDWCAQRNESWDGIESSGWMLYSQEYLAFLITKFLEEKEANHDKENPWND
jgi:hypothetical protein